MIQGVRPNEIVIVDASEVYCFHCEEPFALIHTEMKFIGILTVEDQEFYLLIFPIPFLCPLCLGDNDSVGIRKPKEDERLWRKNYGQFSQGLGGSMN